LQVSVVAKLFGSLLVCVRSVGTSAGYVVCLLCRTMLRRMFDHLVKQQQGPAVGTGALRGLLPASAGGPTATGVGAVACCERNEAKAGAQALARECVSLLAC
jgi:hypothetical protein